MKRVIEKSKSLSIKLALIVGLLVFISIFATIAIFMAESRNLAKETAKNSISAEASIAALNIASEVNQTTAEIEHSINQLLILRELKGVSRDFIRQTIKHQASHNPNYFGISNSWEPNKFDNNDKSYAGVLGNFKEGKFDIYWYHQGDSLVLFKPTNSWAEELKSNIEWYEVPQKTKKPHFFVDLYPINNQKILMTTLEFPILENNEFLGVYGIDYRSDFLQQRALILKENLFNGRCQVSILSDNAEYAANTLTDTIIGKSIKDLTPDTYDATIKDIATGISHFEEVNDTLYFSKPIKFKAYDKPWLIKFAIANSVILERSNNQLITQLLLGFLIVILSIAIAILLLKKQLKPLVHLTGLTKKIAEGDLEVEINQGHSDEIGELSKSFKRMVEKINELISIEKQSKQYHQAIINSVNDAIFVHDAKGKIINMNAKACRMYNYTPEEFYEINAADLSANIEPYTRDNAKSMLQKAIIDGESMFEWLAKTSTGQMFWVEINISTGNIGSSALFFVSVRDISERKKAQEIVHASELFRELVYNCSPIPIVVIETDSFRFIDCNPAATKAFGFSSRNETLGKTPFDVSPYNQYDGSPSTEKAIYYINKAKRDGTAVFDWHHQRPNGELWDTEVHLLPFVSNNQTLIQCSLVDITERNKAEQSLRESEEKYRTLMENLNDVILLVDNDDQILYINKIFTKKVGYTLEEVIGKRAYQLFIEPASTKINTDWLKKQSSKYELEFIAKDGTKIDFLVNGAPMENTDGKVTGSIGAMIDITLHNKAEQELKESQDKFRALAENLPGVIYLCKNDERWSMLYINDEVENLTGYIKEDFLDNTLSFVDLYHPDDLKSATELASNNLDASKPFHIQFRIKHKNGEWRWLDEIGMGIERNGECELIEGFITDITEKKNNELELQTYRTHLEKLVRERTDELASTNEELQTSNQELFSQREAIMESMENLKIAQTQLVQNEKMASLGLLASGIAHEINNPLNFIHGGVLYIDTYIKDNFPEISNEILPVIEGINTGIERAALIVKSLNQYNRSDTLPFTKCNLHEIIDNCLVMLQNQYKNKIELKKQYTTEHYDFEGNDGKLHQAFLNILANAGQAVDDNGEVKIATNIVSKEIQITISDNGHGISESSLEKIFDPFYTTKEPGKGTGLGLSITYAIIQEHKGSIKFESKIGVGTQVKIKLPVKKQKS